MQRVDQQAAYLLHRRPFRDSSVIVDLLTLDWGRLALVAQGVRKSRSSMAGVLQPHQRLLVSWRGRGALPTLSGAELLGAPIYLPGDALIAALYLNELLMRLMPVHVANPLLFALYQQGLERLAAGEDIEWSLRVWERDLLEELGYGLNLVNDVCSGEALMAVAPYCYRHEHGAELEHGPCSGVRLHGATLIALQQGVRPDRESRQQAKQLMRYTLAHYLGPRPLISRSLFKRPVVGQNRES